MELAILLTQLLSLLSSKLPTSPSRPRIVVIEGNVGSGKSTLLNRLRLTHGDVVHVLEEPVTNWTNLNGTDLLERLFNESKRWTFAFQLYSSLTRYVDLLDTLRHWDGSKRVLVLERSVYSGRYCFLEAEYEMGNLTDVEYAILVRWFDVLHKQLASLIKPDRIVYLRSDMASLERHISKRGRSEESRLNMDFLKSVQKWHDQWLTLHDHDQSTSMRSPPAPVITLNTGHLSLEKFEELVDAEADNILF